MGNETTTGRVYVETLADLDALIGRYITGEKPHSHWEDSHAHLHFDSLEEALESLREPYFQQFIPEEERARTVLREIEEFRCYSTDLEVAWEIVVCLGTPKIPFHVWRDGELWRAAFGDEPSAGAPTVPHAICLAGLRLRGVEVEFPASGLDDSESGSRIPDSFTDQIPPDLLAD